jgi:hypothetical protein
MHVRIVLQDGRSFSLEDSSRELLAEFLEGDSGVGRILDQAGGWIILQDGSSLLQEYSIYVHPRGRQPIGVNQPNGGGTVYPFLRDSVEAPRLLADFYLSYEDDVCQFRLPFRVSWLYGFGATANGLPVGMPTPTHPKDLRVVDALDQVVFDSTQAIDFRSRYWDGQRLEILEWQVGYAICRAIRFNAWTVGDVVDHLDQPYFRNIVPSYGTLDARTLDRIPRRVRSIRVGTQVFTASRLVLQSGYNVDIQQVASTDEDTGIEAIFTELTDTVDAVIPGTRVTNQVSIAANPGGGMGQAPGCGDNEPVVKLINEIGPAASGNMTLDGLGCIRAQRPVGVIAETPRTFRYEQTGMTDIAAASTIALHNDCGPCCDCDYFVRTYEGIRREWKLWGDMAVEAVNTRDTMQRNIDRWEAARICRTENSLRAIVIAEAGCKVTAGAIYCNNHQCCIKPVIFRFTFFSYSAGVLEDLEGSDCGEGLVDGSPVWQSENAPIAGKWPVFELSLEYANPVDSSSASLRVCLPNCNAAKDIQVAVTMHYPDMTPNDGKACETPSLETPSDLAAVWAGSDLGPPLWPVRALVRSKLVPMNPVSPFCQSCQCKQDDP